MAARKFGNTGNMEKGSNYGIRKLPDGKRAFMKECAATDEGAIQMVRQKDGTNHKAGDIFFCSGGNAIGGVVKGMWIKDGYQSAVAKNINIGFLSINETTGKPERDFLKLSLLDDDGRIDNQTARVLAAIKKADLGEEVLIAIHTFAHKAGDKMSETSEAVWDKDGDSTILSVYQAHLATQDNPHGRITLGAEDYFNQPTYYVKGKEVIDLERGEKPPVGIKASYNIDAATEFYSEVVEGVNAAVKDHKFAAPAHDEGAHDTEFSGEDVTFGEEEGDAARSRMSARP